MHGGDLLTTGADSNNLRNSNQALHENHVYSILDKKKEEKGIKFSVTELELFCKKYEEEEKKERRRSFKGLLAITISHILYGQRALMM